MMSANDNQRIRQFRAGDLQSEIDAFLVDR
jgi:site-specific recombinase XerD